MSASITMQTQLGDTSNNINDSNNAFDVNSGNSSMMVMFAYHDASSIANTGSDTVLSMQGMMHMILTSTPMPAMMLVMIAMSVMML